MSFQVTKFDPADFEVICEHLQFPDLRRIHDGGILRFPHTLPVGIGFQLSTGAPTGLVG